MNGNETTARQRCTLVPVTALAIAKSTVYTLTKGPIGKILAELIISAKISLFFLCYEW